MSKSTGRSPSRRRVAGDVVTEQQRLQTESDRHDAKPAGKNAYKAPATSPRRRPSKPPVQRLAKPGLEADLVPRPQFEAPTYQGSDKLAGQVALITGGDSGIGRAVAVLYAREGANVVIVHLPAERADASETVEHIRREGQECMAIAGDVRDFAFCKRVIARTIKRFGRLDVLVNNAAFQQHADSLEALSLDHFDLTVKTNLYGYFHMAKAAVPHMKEGSCIINTGSETGLFGNDKLLDYASTKGAIHAFTQSLASNLISRGIRVNCVAPGPVWTPLNPADRVAEDIPEFGRRTDMKRPAQPEEISPAYVFLASPSCASYITGIVLPILGGVPS